MTRATIAEAVACAYAAFADERLPTSIACAPSENRELTVDTIRSVPVRQLDADQLSLYAFCAMTTIGDAAAYRHFLPRILELAADGAAEMGLEPEVIAGKLVYADWRNWHADQQQAVAVVFDAAALLAFAAPLDDGCRIENWLAAIARLDLPLDQLLVRWRDDRSTGALVQLATFASEWAGHKRETVPPYWEDVPVPTRIRVRDWLLGRDTMVQLADGLSRIGEEDRWVLAGAIDRIRLRLS